MSQRILRSLRLLFRTALAGQPRSARSSQSPMSPRTRRSLRLLFRNGARRTTAERAEIAKPNVSANSAVSAVALRAAHARLYAAVESTAERAELAEPNVSANS